MSSSATIQPVEHQIPAGALRVEFKICENCGRNFYRCLESGGSERSPLCCNCRAQLKTPGNQIWRCCLCGTERAWGTGAPTETASKQLRCVNCGPEFHRFVEVA
jgi:hypothetical protein